MSCSGHRAMVACCLLRAGNGGPLFTAGKGSSGHWPVSLDGLASLAVHTTALRRSGDARGISRVELRRDVLLPFRVSCSMARDSTDAWQRWTPEPVETHG